MAPFKPRSSSRKFACKIDPDRFCFVCGFYIPKKQKGIGITTKFREAYRAVFDFDLADQDKDFCPHVVCMSCHSNMFGWMSGKRSSVALKLYSPMLWFEPNNHETNCWFCCYNPLPGLLKQKKKKKNTPANKREYPNSVTKLTSVKLPVKYNADNQHLKPSPPPVSKSSETDDEDDHEDDHDDDDKDSDYELQLDEPLMELSRKRRRVRSKIK